MFDLADAEFELHYPSNFLYVIFLVLLLTNLQVNYDHGVLPAVAALMMNEYNLSSLQFGSIGSSVYAGLVIGALSGSRLYASASFIKPTLLVATIMNCILNIVFAFMTQFGWFFLVKLCMGFFQVFIAIFMPVWIDAFAP